MLITPAQLNLHRQDPSWIVFDCRHDLLDAQRGARVYAEGHVPGAYFAPVDTVLAGEKNGRNGRHPLPAPADFADFLNRHGVKPNTQIVAYDDAGGLYAARLWWLARWIGLSKVAVLDGGLGKWIGEGHPLDTAVPAPRRAGTVVARPHAARLRSASDILASLGTATCVVLDARAAERYRGETEPVDPVAGHIPGALNRFFKANLNADLTMRPAAELHREFKALLGAWRPDQVVHQCGSGITACANLLAMEHAGLSGSKLYPGSWSEWVSDPTRPVARG